MKILLLLSGTLYSFFAFSQHTLGWGYAPESSNNRESIGSDVQVDFENSTYVLGVFNGLIELALENARPVLRIVKD